jgi:hypothetical protein
MSNTGTALAPTPTQGPNQALVEEKLKLQGRVRSGAGWLFAVAGFSVINSTLVFFHANLHFIVGLGITQIADGVGKSAGSGGAIAGFIVSLFMAGLFALFGKFAREENQWAFIAGIVIYGLDGLIFLAFGEMLDLAFHAFAIYCMFQGLRALGALNKLNAQPVNFAVSSSLAK